MIPRILPAAMLAASLAGCATSPTTPAPPAALTAAVTAYALADASIVAYNATPAAVPATVAALRQCDAAAWSLVQPVTDALIAGHTPTALQVTFAAAAAAALDACLVGHHVSLLGG